MYNMNATYCAFKGLCHIRSNIIMQFVTFSLFWQFQSPKFTAVTETRFSVPCEMSCLHVHEYGVVSSGVICSVVL